MEAVKLPGVGRKTGGKGKVLLACGAALGLTYASLCFYAYKVRQASYVEMMEYELLEHVFSDAKIAQQQQEGVGPSAGGSLLRPGAEDGRGGDDEKTAAAAGGRQFSYRNMVARVFGLEKLKRLKDGYHLVWQSMVNEEKLKKYLKTKTTAAYTAAYEGVLSSLFAEDTRYQMDRAYQVLQMVFDDGDERLSNLERFAGLLVLQHLVRRQLKSSDTRAAQQAKSNPRESQSTSGEFRIKLASLSVARHFMRFASAAYGWALLNDVFFSDKDRPKYFDRGIQGERQTNLWCLIQHTKIDPEDILQAKWSSSHFNPAHYVCVDHTTRSLVVAIRGTFDFADILTDLQATPAKFNGGLAHGGILESARLKLEMVLPILKENLAHPRLENYSVVCVGHSLGAGVAALLALLLEEELHGVQVKCFAFGCPCILSLDLADRTSHIISTWVHNSDIVPRLCVASARDLGRRAGRAFKETRRNMKRKVVTDGVQVGTSPAKEGSTRPLSGPSSGGENSKSDSSPGLRPQLSPGTSPRVLSLNNSPRPAPPSVPLLPLPLPTFSSSYSSSTRVTAAVSSESEGGAAASIVSISTTAVSYTSTSSQDDKKSDSESGSEHSATSPRTRAPPALSPRGSSPRLSKSSSPALSTRVAARFTGSMKAVMRKMNKSLALASTIRLHMGLSMNTNSISDVELSESEQSALSAAGSDWDPDNRSGSDGDRTPTRGGGRSRSASEASLDGDADASSIRDAMTTDFNERKGRQQDNPKLTVDDHPRLFPPSRIFHVSRNSVNQSHSIAIKNPSMFAHIPLTEGQFTDHFPHAYENALRAVQLQYAPRHAEMKLVRTGTLKLKHMAQTIQVQQNFQLLQRMQQQDQKRSSDAVGRGVRPFSRERAASHSRAAPALFGQKHQRPLPSVSFGGGRRNSFSGGVTTRSSSNSATVSNSTHRRAPSAPGGLVHSIRSSVVSLRRNDERKQLQSRSQELFEAFNGV